MLKTLRPLLCLSHCSTCHSRIQLKVIKVSLINSGASSEQQQNGGKWLCILQSNGVIRNSVSHTCVTFGFRQLQRRENPRKQLLSTLPRGVTVRDCECFSTRIKTERCSVKIHSYFSAIFKHILSVLACKMNTLNFCVHFLRPALLSVRITI